MSSDEANPDRWLMGVSTWWLRFLSRYICITLRYNCGMADRTKPCRDSSRASAWGYPKLWSKLSELSFRWYINLFDVNMKVSHFIQFKLTLHKWWLDCHYCSTIGNRHHFLPMQNFPLFCHKFGLCAIQRCHHRVSYWCGRSGCLVEKKLVVQVLAEIMQFQLSKLARTTSTPCSSTKICM